MRKIIHIDLDYFYAQVEELEKPWLKERPFAVGGDGMSRGVLCTCNYVARRFGVRSAMPAKIALEKCPDLELLPVNMEKYKAVSKQIRDVFYRFTDQVEPLSLDEAYLDVTNVQDFSNSATLIARAIKKDIEQLTGLTASAGIGPNKLLAKIASDINKPNGLYVIRPEDVDDFIKEMPVKKLFGVGKVMQEKLAHMGVVSCADLQRFEKDKLELYFGKFGLNLYEYCRGRDVRDVNPDRMRKSIGVENTYAEDLKTKEACLERLDLLHQDLIRRIEKHKAGVVSGIFVKLTDARFNKLSVTRQTHHYSFEFYTLLFDELYNKTSLDIRLLGLGVKLGSSESQQMELEL